MGVVTFLLVAFIASSLTGEAVGLTKEEFARKLSGYKERALSQEPVEDLERELDQELPTTFGPLCVSLQYKLFIEPSLFWDEARQACEDDGGRLAVIRDARTSSFMKAYLNRSAVKRYVGSGIWIGINDIEEEGTLMTSDGHPFYADDCNVFQDWTDDQPDDNMKRDPEGQDCVQLWKARNFSWDDDYCNYRPKSYICEYDVCSDECVACP
ncbi:lectin BRA-3-like [Ptychodera flava]|uniref:lectin BRA-3-like n=1 Tax=Ptychodera flava TaxID=63121 RepID=UPI00396AAC40